MNTQPPEFSEFVESEVRNSYNGVLEYNSNFDEKIKLLEYFAIKEFDIPFRFTWFNQCIDFVYHPHPQKWVKNRFSILVEVPIANFSENHSIVEMTDYFRSMCDYLSLKKADYFHDIPETGTTSFGRSYSDDRTGFVLFEIIHSSRMVPNPAYQNESKVLIEYVPPPNDKKNHKIFRWIEKLSNLFKSTIYSNAR